MQPLKFFKNLDRKNSERVFHGCSTGWAVMAEIIGTTGNDTITGTAAADTIYGGDGIDKIGAGLGNDIVYGGAGNDNIVGDYGDDKIYGEVGDDLIFGHAGRDELYGGEGNDGFYGGGDIDKIYGEAGNDVMFGDGGGDILDGGAGNDKLYGGTGDDTLLGGAGIDLLNGDAGNDTFVVRPGDGNDTINGGLGTDNVVLDVTGADVTAAFRADVVAYNTWMQGLLATSGGTEGLSAQTTGTTFTFSSIGVTMSVIEGLSIQVDGVAAPLSTFLNQAPVTSATANVTMDEDATVNGQVSATDADGNTLTWTVNQGPAHGTLSINSSTGDYVYAPGANFNGSDTFTVTVTDTAGASAAQQVNVGVNAINDAPVTEGTVTLATDEDTAVNGSVTASDIEGDTLSYAVSQGPAHGTLTLNASTGAYTYTPDANYNGGDTFSVTVSDGAGGTAVQQITVGVTAVNDGPVADATASQTTAEDTPLNGQVMASDVDGDTLSYAVSQGPAHGTLTLNASTGAYTYSAAANYSGAETFTVKVSDTSGAFTTQLVSVAVGAVADAPVVTASNASVTAGITVNGTGGNDTLAGTSGNDFIYGGGGNDTITGSGPNPADDRGAEYRRRTDRPRRLGVTFDPRHGRPSGRLSLGWNQKYRWFLEPHAGPAERPQHDDLDGRELHVERDGDVAGSGGRFCIVDGDAECSFFSRHRR